MRDYVRRVEILKERFQQLEIRQIPRDENQRADFLSKVVSSMIDATERKITLFGVDQALQVMTVTDGPNDWRVPIVQYLRGERHGSLKEVARMEAMGRFYYLIGDILYRKTFLPMDAKCLSRQ